MDRLEQEIEQLKQEERKRRSAALQRKLFEQLNPERPGRGEGLMRIVRPLPRCAASPERVSAAAPKLCNTPTSISWNRSPWLSSGGAILPRRRFGTMDIIIRLAKGKCEPILHHMLQGLRVDENPLLADSHRETKLDILYEDDYLLIVNKPAGMLSVPGRETRTPSITGCISFIRMPPARLSCIVWIWRHPACYSPPRPKKRIRTYKPNSKTEPSRKGISPY